MKTILFLAFFGITFCSGQPTKNPVKVNYEPLSLNSIKPKGWLLHQLRIMRNGSTGHLDEIYDKIKNANGWLGGSGDGWEETPYWMDGATPEQLREVHWYML